MRKCDSEKKAKCDPCDDCIKRYPSLDPRVPASARLKMFLREVHRPLVERDDRSEAVRAIDALLALVANPPESLTESGGQEKSEPEGDLNSPVNG